MSTAKGETKSNGDRGRRRRIRWLASILAPVLAAFSFVLAETPSTPVTAATALPRVTVTPNAVSLAAGSSVDLTVSFAASRPRVTWSLPGRPAGVSASFRCASLRTCSLSLSADQGSIDSITLLQLRLVAGSSSRTVPIALHVRAATPPTFPPTTVAPPTLPTTTVAPVTRTLLLRPTNLIATIRPGTRATFAITVVREGIGNDPVSLSLAALPTGWQAAFVPNPTVGDSTVLIVDVPQSASIGDYPIRVAARSGTLLAETPLVIRLRQPEITLALLSAPTSIAAGTTGRYLFDVRSTDDPSKAVSVRVEGLPGGVAAVGTPSPGVGTLALDINVAASVPPLFTSFTVVASRDGVEVRLPVSLSITTPVSASFVFTPTPLPPVPGEFLGYGLVATPSSLAVARGSSASFDVRVTPRGGFVSPLNVSLGMPSGWTVVWSNVTANVFRATVTVPAGGPTGSVALTLSTSSGALVASVGVAASVS